MAGKFVFVAGRLVRLAMKEGFKFYHLGIMFVELGVFVREGVVASLFWGGGVSSLLEESDSFLELQFMVLVSLDPCLAFLLGEWLLGVIQVLALGSGV